MRRILLLVAGAGVLASGCQASSAGARAEPEPTAQPAPPPPNASHVPAGTVLLAELTDELSTRATRVGDAFTVEVQHALVAENRDTVIPAGAVITGLVTGVGRTGEHAAIRLNFTRIGIGGASHPFTASITATRIPEEHTAMNDAAQMTTALGAVIGDGELRAALVKGPLGAGAGTIISLGVGGEQQLPGGTQLTLLTRDRIDLERR